MVTTGIIRNSGISAGDRVSGWRRSLIENFESFRDSLIVERNNNDRNRVDVQCKPADIVNQFRIFAE